MSEYIEIESEPDEDQLNLIHFFTNLLLTTDGQTESYQSLDEMLEGSAVAQALAEVDGIVSVTLTGGEMSIEKEDDLDAYALIADVSAAIKDFFL
ncbi:MAG: NifU N-terminal domain-containing protein [Anaerolineae bacterium]